MRFLYRYGYWSFSKMTAVHQQIILASMLQDAFNALQAIATEDGHGSIGTLRLTGLIVQMLEHQSRPAGRATSSPPRGTRPAVPGTGSTPTQQNPASASRKTVVVSDSTGRAVAIARRVLRPDTTHSRVLDGLTELRLRRMLDPNSP
jgi:hypothetical protein